MTKNIFFNESKVDSHRYKRDFPMKASEFEIFHSVKGYDKKELPKIEEKFQRCRKAHSFQTIKEIYLKLRLVLRLRPHL